MAPFENLSNHFWYFKTELAPNFKRTFFSKKHIFAAKCCIYSIFYETVINYKIKWRQIIFIKREIIVTDYPFVNDPLAPFQKLNNRFLWIKTEMAPNLTWTIFKELQLNFWNFLFWKDFLAKTAFFLLKLAPNRIYKMPIRSQSSLYVKIPFWRHFQNSEIDLFTSKQKRRQIFQANFFF